MIRLAADEDFNADIVRGVLRRNPAIDILRVHDAGFSGVAIEDVLLVAECSLKGEWEGQVRYIPMITTGGLRSLRFRQLAERGTR